MSECPCCHGEGGFDLSDMDVPLERLARVFGAAFEPLGIAMCDVCEGEGEVSEQVQREYQAWAVARVDQFLAAVDAGEVVIP